MSLWLMAPVQIVSTYECAASMMHCIALCRSRCCLLSEALRASECIGKEVFKVSESLGKEVSRASEIVSTMRT
jgi:hypothetical protein